MSHSPLTVAGMAIGLLVVLPQMSEAQDRHPHSEPFPGHIAELGLRTGYDAQLGVASAGGQLRFPLGLFVEILASGDYFLSEGVSQWQANADAGFRPLPTELIYGGIGLSIARRVLEPQERPGPLTRPGVNLLGGIATPRQLRSSIRPYAEARWTFIRDYDRQFSLVGGINVRLGKR